MKRFLNSMSAFTKIFLVCLTCSLLGSLIFCFENLMFLTPFAIALEVLSSIGIFVFGVLAIGNHFDWQ